MPLDDVTTYWIARGQQTFGPYTGAEVRQYVASGNIVAGDLIRGPNDREWLPINTVLQGTATAPGLAPLTAPPPAGAPPATPRPATQLAVWSLVCGVVGMLCCGFFSSVPGLILGAMALKRPPEDAKPLAIAGIVLNIIATLFSILSLIFIPMLLSAMMRMAGQ